MNLKIIAGMVVVLLGTIMVGLARRLEGIYVLESIFIPMDLMYFFLTLALMIMVLGLGIALKGVEDYTKELNIKEEDLK